MRSLLVIAVVAPLVGCSAVSATTAGDTIGCAAALAATGVVNPSAIPALALSTPACVGLAKDVLDTVIAQAQSHAVAARRTMRLAP